jgi:uncharacterized protein YlxW (UPF0749 family)
MTTKQDTHVRLLQADVERLHVEKAELARRVRQLERALAKAESERDAGHASVSRIAALRSDVAQILAVVLDIQTTLDEEEEREGYAEGEEENSPPQDRPGNGSATDC